MEPADKRRVVAGVSGTLGSLTALHRAAAEARRTDAVLRAVLAWSPPGGELGQRNQPWPALLTECHRVAGDRLLRAVDTAFGPAGPGVPMEALVVRGTPGVALIGCDERPRGPAGRRGGARGVLRRTLRPSVARYCLAHAACPVLAVPPSPLQDDIAAVHRRISWHIPLNSGKFAD